MLEVVVMRSEMTTTTQHTFEVIESKHVTTEDGVVLVLFVFDVTTTSATFDGVVMEE